MITLRKSKKEEHAADIWVEDGHIYVEAYPSEKRAVEQLLSLFPPQAKDPSILTYQYVASPTTASKIRELFGNYGRYHESFDDLLLYGSKASTANALKLLDPETFPEIPKLSGSSWPHQRQGYSYISRVLGVGSPTRHSAGAGLFMDMGVGKSRVGVGTILNSDSKRVLIVCPKRVMGVWPNEFKKHTLEEFRPKVRLLTGSTAERASIIRRTKNESGVFVVNYDALVYKVLADAMIEVPWDMILLDEAHKIKSPGGKTSQFLARLGRKARYRLALTGTPAADKPLDVYGIYRFLDPGIFGTSYNRFREQYAVMGGYQGREVIGYRNQDELSEKMYTIAFRVTNEVLNLPPTIENIIRVKLGNKAREVYEKMQEEMVVSIADGSATVTNSLTKILRMQQITSGYLPVEINADEGEQPLSRIEEFEQDKYETLVELISSMPENEPVVCFAKFIYDLTAIKKAAAECGREYMEISGRRSDLEDFQKSTNGTVLGVQMSAGAVGIDLTRAHYAVYYSLTHSLSNYAQSLARLHRPGQNNTVIFYYLLASNTIDNTIKRALDQKKSVVDVIMEDMSHGGGSLDQG